MAFSLLSSSSWSWLGWEIGMMVIAAIGGLIVLIGLWMERDEDREQFRNTSEYWNHKARHKSGEKLVRVGVFVEILVAVFIAAQDGWEMHSIKQTAIASDPRNKPIVSASAVLTLRVSDRSLSSAADSAVKSFDERVFDSVWNALQQDVLNSNRVSLEIFAANWSGPPITLQNSNLSDGGKLPHSGGSQHLITLFFESDFSHEEEASAAKKTLLPATNQWKCFSPSDFERCGGAKLFLSPLPVELMINGGSCTIFLNSIPESFSFSETTQAVIELIRDHSTSDRK